MVNKSTWEECSHIKTETTTIFKSNKNINHFTLEFNIPEYSLFKTFTDLNTYNTITEIDNTKYYEFNIIKECNIALQELIKKQVIKKPTFEKTQYPMDTYKPFIKPKTPCKGTLQFKKKDNTNWENILAKIKMKKKEKHKK